MTRLLGRIAALLIPLVLTGCLLTPGKFVSTLRLDADRHFTFTYVGEVYAMDPSASMTDGARTDSSADPARGDDDAEGDEPAMRPAILVREAPPHDTAPAKDDAEAKNRAIAAALMKEAGYRRAEYVGGGKFNIDYAISGTLDHAFVWPFNVDAEIVIPFVAIEPRANGTVRVKAPGFANDSKMNSGSTTIPGTDKASSKLDGTFTLDTDAEIVSQNNEDGVKTTGARKTISWRATPTTKDAPTAVLKMLK